jgi:hypothetical protein
VIEKNVPIIFCLPAWNASILGVRCKARGNSFFFFFFFFLIFGVEMTTTTHQRGSSLLARSGQTKRVIRRRPEVAINLYLAVYWY